MVYVKANHTGHIEWNFRIKRQQEICNIVQSAIAIDSAWKCMLRQAHDKGGIIDHVSDI